MQYRIEFRRIELADINLSFDFISTEMKLRMFPIHLVGVYCRCSSSKDDVPLILPEIYPRRSEGSREKSKLYSSTSAISISTNVRVVSGIELTRNILK